MIFQTILNNRKRLVLLFRNRRKKFLKEKFLYSQKPQVAGQEDSLSSDLDENIQVLNSIYQDCYDVIFKTFLIGGQTKAVLIYIDGLSNIEEIDDHVLSPLMGETDGRVLSSREMLEKKLHISKTKEIKTFLECIEHISIGDPVLLVQQNDWGLSMGLCKWEKLSIEVPQAESVVRGPREGFVETLAINTSLLRRKIKSPALKINR